MSSPIPLAQFVADIKSRFPRYADVPDDKLAADWLNLYPRYRDHVSIPPPTVRPPPGVEAGSSSTAPSPEQAQFQGEFGPWLPGYDAEGKPTTMSKSQGPTKGDYGRAARKLAPYAGGAALALAGPPGWIAAGGMAALGGAGGEAFGQIGERIASGEGPATGWKAAEQIGTAGLEQGRLEVGGQTLGGVARAGKSLIKPPPGSARLTGLAEELGLPARATGAKKLLTENTAAGRTIGTKLGKQGLTKASQALEEPAAALGVAPPPAEVGAIRAFPATAKKAASESLGSAQAKVDETLAQLAAPGGTKITTGDIMHTQTEATKGIAMRKAEELYKASDAANADALMDITPKIRESMKAARLRINETPGLRDSTLSQTLDKILGKPPKPGAKTAKSTLGLPDQITYAQARAIQKSFAQAFDSTQGQLISNEVKGIGKKLWGDWSDALRNSLARQPGVQGPPMVEHAMAAMDRTVEGGGTAGLSAEELSRSAGKQTYYRVSRSGELTHMGPQPDPAAALRPGEGVVKVTPSNEPMVTQANGPDSVVLSNFQRNAPPPPTFGSPGLDAFDAAQAHYSKVAGLYKRGVVPKIMKAYPSKLVDMIPDKTPEVVTALKEATFGQAMQHGTSAEAHQALDSWNTFGETFLRDRILQDGTAGIAKNFEKVGPEVIREMFNTTPASRVAIGNLRQFGIKAEQAAERIKDVSDVVRQSQVAGHAVTQGGVGGLSYKQFTGVAALDILFGKLLAPIGAVEVAAEGIGGFISWAMYRPAAAAKLIDTLGAIGTQSPRAASALQKLYSQYKSDQPPPPPPATNSEAP